MTAPSGGQYEPVNCTVYRPTLSVDNGEPVTDPHATDGTLIYTGRIRFVRQVYGREAISQGRVDSTNQVYIRMNRNVKTVSITPDMTIHHRGNVYGIIGINDIPYTDDEIEFICQTRNQVM